MDTKIWSKSEEKWAYILVLRGAEVSRVKITGNVLTLKKKVQGALESFAAWLSYPSGDRAWKAFQVLHEILNARGFGVRQWTRDLIVPKQ